jgi:hypothetical protein
LNWKNIQWKQKYKCKKCNYCFVKKYKQNDNIRTNKIFDEWIKEWYSSRQLLDQKIKNKKEIFKEVRKRLDTNLIYQVDIIFENVKYLMIDWTWITSEICLIIYYDYVNKKVVRFWFYDWEKYEYIKNDLLVLRDEFKYEIEYFVVDWGKQIKKAVEKIFSTAKIQRCLTHIQRQIKNYISNNPKSDCGKELQKIITFENFKNKENFIKEFNLWNEKWTDFLKEKSSNWNKSWYIHTKLRWARSHIKNAIPYMFYFLKNENIKKSSNDLEWYNWVLSDNIYKHRWLRIDRLISFISIWIYNRNLPISSTQF